jgi:hypothetical protein
MLQRLDPVALEVDDERHLPASLKIAVPRGKPGLQTSNRFTPGDSWRSRGYGDGRRRAPPVRWPVLSDLPALLERPVTEEGLDSQASAFGSSLPRSR